jgi:hypothetical protein
MLKKEVALGGAQLRTEENSLDPELELCILEGGLYLLHLETILFAEGQEDIRLDHI